MNHLNTRKTPRDFVHIDEFWEADNHWSHYYFNNTIWIYVDEYRAELTGDADYARIIIHSGNNRGWIFSRRLHEKSIVLNVLSEIDIPVSEKQLKGLGFNIWQGE